MQTYITDVDVYKIPEKQHPVVDRRDADEISVA